MKEAVKIENLDPIVLGINNDTGVVAIFNNWGQIEIHEVWVEFDENGPYLEVSKQRRTTPMTVRQAAKLAEYTRDLWDCPYCYSVNWGKGKCPDCGAYIWNGEYALESYTPLEFQMLNIVNPEGAMEELQEQLLLSRFLTCERDSV